MHACTSWAMYLWRAVESCRETASRGTCIGATRASMDGDDYTRSSEELIHMRIFMRPAAAGILTLALFAACKRDRDQSAAGSLDNARASLPPVDTFTAAA